jgi:hypothetical protein
MKHMICATLVFVVSAFAGGGAWAKLPAAPALDDAAKAKAAEAAAKTAWSGKVDGFMLCKSMEKSAANYLKTAASAGKPVKAATATPPCADPGPFVYTPAGSVPAPAPTAAIAPAAPAAAASPTPAKKS